MEEGGCEGAASECVYVYVWELYVVVTSKDLY